MELWTAFMIGLVGSFHCVGMCGPIAMALPYRSSSKFRSVSNVLLYNAGRILTYTTLGLLVGIVGRGISLSGYQQWMSILLGIGLFFIGLFSLNIESQVLKINWIHQLTMKVKAILGKLLQSPRPQSLFTIGVLNGFLPCGFVYVGLAGSVISNSLLNSALYMTLFGIGTVPLMLTTTLASSFLSLSLRRNIQKMIPFFMLFFAVLFILRGMNLGIPYVSPHLSSEEVKLIICH
ncbi:MAG: sulfite exporter TauE/SafE family protein [Chitinophagales bacterium]